MSLQLNDIEKRLMEDHDLSEVEANIILYLSTRKRSTVGKIRKFFMYPVDTIDFSIISLFERGFINKEEKTYRGTIPYTQIEITNKALKELEITKLERELFVVDNKLRKLELRKKSILEKMDKVNDYST